MPMGQFVMVQLVYRPYVVNMGDIEMLADLMLVDMVDINAILGMDWLASCHTLGD